MRGVSDPRTVVAVVVKTDALLAKICTRALAYYGAAPLSLLTRGIAAAQSVRTGPLFVAPLRTSRCAPLARAAHGDHSYWLDRRPECLMSMRVYCGSQVFMVRSELVSKLMKKNPHLTARWSTRSLPRLQPRCRAVTGSSYAALEISARERGLRVLA